MMPDNDQPEGGVGSGLFREQIWECKIGGPVPLLPSESDWPMRVAVQRAYFDVTGVKSEFTFSGWAGTLTEPERAVVENREPSEEYHRQWEAEHAPAPSPSTVDWRTRAEQAEARVQGLEEAVRGLLDHCSECGAVATWSQYVHEDTYYACDDHHGAMRGGYIRPLDDETETAARAALAAAPALCSCGHAMRDHTGDFALVCSVCGSHAAAPRPSHVPYQDGTWLDWRPVGELTDDELREQSQASLDFTNRALRNGQHGDDHALKVVRRGFEIGREQMRRAALATGVATTKEGE